MDVDRVEKLLSIGDKLAGGKYPMLAAILAEVGIELAQINKELEDKKAKAVEEESHPARTTASRSR